MTDYRKILMLRSKGCSQREMERSKVASREKTKEVYEAADKLVHTPDQQLHLHGILAPPSRKGAPLHESKERDLYNWRSTGNCDYINWRSHHAKLSGDLETG